MSAAPHDVSPPDLAALRRHLEAVQACERCPQMHRPAVVGRATSSRILLIGQAPGDKEPKLQRPFAWTAGKTLFKWLDGALGWTEDDVRDRVYFAAVCRCFPGKRATGGDRVPSPEEIATCRHWLDREFALLRPQLVLLVGKLAIQQFYDVGALKDIIGQTLTLDYGDHRADCIPLPHPSGASTWHRTEPGKSLLDLALKKMSTHPAVVAAGQGGRRPL